MQARKIDSNLVKIIRRNKILRKLEKKQIVTTKKTSGR